MKKLIITIFGVLLLAFGSEAQTRKTPLNASPKPPVSMAPEITEIPENEWAQIVKSLAAEDWNQTSWLASLGLKKLKNENEKQQLARLRYFYLYSLAGKVSQAKLTFTELEKISEALLGQDFLMPSRKILADCKQALNYICAVKGYSKTWRVTATNQAFTSIYSFEYVQLPEKFEIGANSGKEVVLGGKLKKIEFNPKKDVSWIMRLYFEQGTAFVATGN